MSNANRNQPSLTADPRKVIPNRFKTIRKASEHQKRVETTGMRNQLFSKKPRAVIKRQTPNQPRDLRKQPQSRPTSVTITRQQSSTVVSDAKPKTTESDIRPNKRDIRTIRNDAGSLRAVRIASNAPRNQHDSAEVPEPSSHR